MIICDNWKSINLQSVLGKEFCRLLGRMKESIDKTPTLEEIILRVRPGIMQWYLPMICRKVFTSVFVAVDLEDVYNVLVGFLMAPLHGVNISPFLLN